MDFLESIAFCWEAFFYFSFSRNITKMQSLKSSKVQLSIIVPVYNVEKYIARAIKSCINQSFGNIEIIIVDDCGNDESINIAYEFAKTDQRIKILHNPRNLKLLRARLEGAKAATSDYIMFLDPDDYLNPLICEKIAQILERSQLLDVLCFGMLIESHQGFTKMNYGIQSDSVALSRCEYFELILQKGLCHWNLCGKVFKKEIYLKTLEDLNQSLNLNMAEDALVYFLMLFHLSYFFILNQEGYFYCKNSESLTQTKDLQRQTLCLYEEQEVIKFISQKLPTIDDKTFLRFAKTMLRDLKLYHQYRKNHLYYLKYRNPVSYCIMRIQNFFAFLIYKARKKVKR